VPTIKKNPLYPNLEAELMRCGITRNELAKELGFSRIALYLRLTGEIEFTLNEARIVCAYIEKKSGRAQSLKNLFNMTY
jgi:DNA-binding XRE family transcriptional regulator